eukprot:scaffold38468_cov55-Attheya_sp.AAC.1
MSNRFSTLLLPVDVNGDIDASASSYSLCLNMYHTFGQVLLSVLTTSTTMFPMATCPKTSRLIQIPNSSRSSQWMGSSVEHQFTAMLGQDQGSVRLEKSE